MLWRLETSHEFHAEALINQRRLRGPAEALKYRCSVLQLDEDFMNGRLQFEASI